MALQTKAVRNALASRVAKAGGFKRVMLSEPTGSPGIGMSCAIWCSSFRTIPALSGYNRTTSFFIFTLQIYYPASIEPTDDIDVKLSDAVDKVMGDILEDLTLGDESWGVDVMSQYGIVFGGNYGYVTIDTKMFRIVTISVPVLVQDTWA